MSPSACMHIGMDQPDTRTSFVTSISSPTLTSMGGPGCSGGTEFIRTTFLRGGPLAAPPRGLFCDECDCSGGAVGGPEFRTLWRLAAKISSKTMCCGQCGPGSSIVTADAVGDEGGAAV